MNPELLGSEAQALDPQDPLSPRQSRHPVRFKARRQPTRYPRRPRRRARIWVLVSASCQARGEKYGFPCHVWGQGKGPWHYVSSHPKSPLGRLFSKPGLRPPLAQQRGSPCPLPQGAAARMTLPHRSLCLRHGQQPAPRPLSRTLRS